MFVFAILITFTFILIISFIPVLVLQLYYTISSMGQPLEFISECTDKPVEYIREIATKEPMFVREEGAYNVNEGGTENESDNI